MATATPADVRLEIDTDLSDSDLSALLDRVARDIERQTSYPEADTDDRRDLEAVVTAIRIATGNSPDASDRTASSVSAGSSRVAYESSLVERLRDKASRLGADDSLIGRTNTGSYEVL